MATKMKQVADDPVQTAWREHRPYLVNLAFRMLGDIGAAEDAVQEAFARLWQSRPGEIDDERGWLIVVTSRLCLDQIKSAHSRRERAHDTNHFRNSATAGTGASGVDPADRVTLDDNVRLALIVVLERLTPAERVVFILHDVFQTPFDLIADTVGKSPAACRQIARRARHKIEQTDGPPRSFSDPSVHLNLTEKFIAACATGDIAGLLEVLDPNVAGTIDVRTRAIVIGADHVSRNLIRFWGAPGTCLVSQTVGDQPALLGFVDRHLAGILLLTVKNERVALIHVLADPAKLGFVQAQLDSALEP
jgi:RNA polymerase sigma-70 factor (ECF subfamily)